MEQKASRLEDFAEEAYVRVVAVSGNYLYGYIQKVTEGGFHLLISLYEQGDSALAYETASGSLVVGWEKMLSETEKAIISRLSLEISVKDIAAELSLSPSTVRSYIRTLRLKLQLDNIQQLIVYSQGMDKVLKEKEE